ncbi:hypothetical protein B0F90DRAFT_1815320 [Multifurca ochricompacta]|uniref:Uncharacterized protein n=1 Tax=Multifurca ochricompacta TaxID=376703 RepID=A0AAD4QPK9_9AGAM|nr:hypothetical protein B0F90DRAFT_1815320 [Multifurca ochricompacta]
MSIIHTPPDNPNHHFQVDSQSGLEDAILHGHRAKTPIVSAIVSSAGVIAIWVLVLAGWLWKQYKKRIRAKRRAAKGLPPKVKKPKNPLPTFILPPDPAVITGQREPGEHAIPKKHGSPGQPSAIELNERHHAASEGQLHDEMIARQVFSKHSILDPPKPDKRHHLHVSRSA